MIYDSFMFFDELELLEIRLHELSGLVDRFVLAEAPVTHSGKPKPLHFGDNKSRFSEFLDRIIHVVVTDFPPTDMSVPGAPWKYERHQREAVMRGIPASAKGQDLLIHGDVDEIPRAEAIRAALPIKSVLALEMKAYGVFLNTYAGPWSHAKVGPVSAFRKDGPYKVRHANHYAVPNAGWHFSSIGTPERISAKMKAYAHQEAEIQKWSDPETIRENIKNGVGLFGFGVLKAEKVDGTFPAHVVSNMDRFRDIILPW